MSNPITPAVEQIIESETPISTAAGASIADFLRQAFDELSAFTTAFQAQAPFEWDPATSSGLTFGFKAGRVQDAKGGLIEEAAGTILLTNAATNYVEFNPATGNVEKNTSAFTTGSLPLYTVVTSGGEFTAENVTDKRPQLAILYGQVVEAANLDDAIADRINTVAFTIGNEVANVRAISLQVKDAQGNNLAERRILDVWLADAADGWLTATGPSGGIAVGTGVQLDVLTAAKRLRVMTDATGLAVLNLTETGTPTWYMAARIGGKVTYSAAITFA